ncbi:hypothetical protein AX766_13875 [Flavobacterium covae]|nr:hypothetical protein AWN65_02890 [Flavobacterium covae]AND65395.1 hypothetical protein AX766_13875 [Flavobacterium covae]
MFNLIKYKIRFLFIIGGVCFKFYNKKVKGGSNIKDFFTDVVLLCCRQKRIFFRFKVLFIFNKFLLMGLCLVSMVCNYSMN